MGDNIIGKAGELRPVGYAGRNVKANSSVLLLGLHTAEEWQCAHEAVKHAETGRRVTLGFTGPNGDDINVSVERKGRQVIARKEP